METPDEKWFRERLRHFLEIRHPPRQFHHVMIERRSRLAFESYAQSVELGVPAASAVRAADKVLFRGLLFSKYDTVHLILTTDFPAIPENQRQEIALRLVRICAPIFRAYDLKDDFSERPEFRQLKEELRTGIRSLITACLATAARRARKSRLPHTPNNPDIQNATSVSSSFT